MNFGAIPAFREREPEQGTVDKGGGKHTMIQTLAAIAKQAARLLLIELLVPGGTLVVLSILLAKGRIPLLKESAVHFNVDNRRLELGSDLVAYYRLRRMQ